MENQQEQTIQQSSVATPLSPTPHKSNILTKLLITILLLCIGAVIGYLFAMSTKPAVISAINEQAQILPVNIPPTIVPEPSNQHVSISEVWNTPLATFTNPGTYITFNYPKAYKLEWSDPGRFDALKISSPEVVVQYKRIENYEQKPLLNVIKEQYKDVKNPANQSVLPTLLQNLQTTDIPIKGSYVYEGMLSETTIKKVFFAYKESVYEFTLFGASGAGEGYTKEQEQFFDTLLSTITLL